MVVLGLFHGLFVLPVILSIINPSSISDIIIKPEIAAAKTETETQKEEGAEAKEEQAQEGGQKEEEEEEEEKLVAATPAVGAVQDTSARAQRLAKLQSQATSNP